MIQVYSLFWLTKLKQLLEQNGFADVWMYPVSVNVKAFIPVLKTRSIDTFLVFYYAKMGTILCDVTLTLKRHEKIGNIFFLK